MNHGVVVLKPGKERAVRLGHPWIFSGAIAKEPAGNARGLLVDILDSKKTFLARGYFNPLSQIRVRILTTDQTQMIDSKFIKNRIRSSIERRARIFEGGQTNCARLVAHESDLLPGLIVDRYGDWIVFQIVTAGMEVWRKEIIESLIDICKPTGVYERSDDAVREKEGLVMRSELVFGEEDRSLIPVMENGMSLLVDVKQGHKTGFYLDQRDNRALIRGYSKDLTVLNCFSFTGGFSVAAMMGGAKNIVSVDESAPALDIAVKNLSNNGFNVPKDSFIKADVFQFLRDLKSRGQSFDLIVLDPPKFASSNAQVDRACRGYKDLNLIAMQLLREGGMLATFSCSGLISRDLFQKVVFGASVDAGSQMQIIRHLSQAECHPTLLTFPESLYLKGFLLRKI